MKRTTLQCITIIYAILLMANTSVAQAVYEDERYIPETDSLVLQKIKEWQGLKFGLLMHWGAYSQWGIVESWSLCPEEYGWCERKKGNNPDNYFAYKQEYENLITTFNPVKFDPEKWAKAAEFAGMKYVVFTTKHHDGFCMFDSKYTDYKVSGPDCPFAENKKSNITKEILDAFRNHGMWAGVYFSKPDWHNENYWNPKYPPKDRNVNYEPEANPEQWQKYIDFTHNQILELMTNYGDIDILWLDGGWVAKSGKQEITSWYDRQLASTDNAYMKHRMVNQDIKMDELVDKARVKQEGLIVVDRAVHGKNQNYLTPENRVPEKPLPYPWESCIISGGGWAYTPNANYMNHRDAIHLLVDIVAKGGNLLLNIAPSPEGEWQQGAYDLLQAYGEWMQINSEAIYNTVVLPPYKENNICMTQNDDNAYFLYLCEENENTMPETITIKGYIPKKRAMIKLLGSNTKLKYKITKEGFEVSIPESLRKTPPSQYVWTIKVEK